jgi:hypothetical protein
MKRAANHKPANWFADKLHVNFWLSADDAKLLKMIEAELTRDLPPGVRINHTDVIRAAIRRWAENIRRRKK